MEFILIVPLLLAMASLMVDLANMVFVTHRMSAATREGARIATETAIPAPENPTAADACRLEECQGVPTICCIAVNRTNLVLFNSGIQGVDVRARWFSHAAHGRTYIMFEVSTSTVVNFFFGLANRTVTASSVAYGNEVSP